MGVALDDNFDRFAVFELFVKGHYLLRGLKALNRTQYADLAPRALVVDVLNNHAHILVYAVI